jgi:23S rRNA (cytidine1920-2'-O)/16S rRNA (cytidine1409-2'-O)-methyltransferase
VPADSDNPFVSRGGLKLRHALGEFGIDPAGLTCADLGCSTGGFTDCLLRAGAARVYAVDTAYGELAWSVRTDPRVRVMERTNALHAEPPEGGVDLVVIDLGWTKQALAVPAALRWLKPGGGL